MLASGKSDRCEGSRSRLTSEGCDRGRARDQAQARGRTVFTTDIAWYRKTTTIFRSCAEAFPVQTKETCHGQTSLAELLEILAVPGRQEQPRQLGRSGSEGPLRRPVRRPRRSREICHVRERPPPAGRDHGTRNSRTRHERKARCK